jgi:hypothetical protein
MRQVVDRVTCDKCGQVFDFEVLRLGQTPIVARKEALTPWLRSLGWECNPVNGSSYASEDLCPNCKGR